MVMVDGRGNQVIEAHAVRSSVLVRMKWRSRVTGKKLEGTNDECLGLCKLTIALLHYFSFSFSSKYSFIV